MPDLCNPLVLVALAYVCFAVAMLIATVVVEVRR